MSLRDDAELVARALGCECICGTSAVCLRLPGGDHHVFYVDTEWKLLVALARRAESALPAEVPEGHERVRVYLWHSAGSEGQSVWSVSMDDEDWYGRQAAIITADIPLPAGPPVVVGRVE